MKRLFPFLMAFAALIILRSESCESSSRNNTTAIEEQAHTESNQRTLLQNQPIPTITWSMERDNLIKLKKLQNDRSVSFFMYIFIEGVPQPLVYGYKKQSDDMFVIIVRQNEYIDAILSAAQSPQHTAKKWQSKKPAKVANSGTVKITNPLWANAPEL